MKWLVRLSLSSIVLACLVLSVHAQLPSEAEDVPGRAPSVPFTPTLAVCGKRTPPQPLVDIQLELPVELARKRREHLEVVVDLDNAPDPSGDGRGTARLEVGIHLS